MKAKKLPSGNYRVQVVAGHDEITGKRIVKSFTADEEWKALKLASDFINNREQLYNHNITLSTAISMYIESRQNIL